MRERKFVKLRVDMYEDTKFKIIDTMNERDLIHYIWTRLVTLAGKVNLEGNLYLSKNIPYTVETLAIEVNRDAEQVKLALNTLIDLEMVELVQDKIYSVKNFVKHQNIKIKEKVNAQDNVKEIKNKEEKSEESIENQLGEEKHINSENQICENVKEVSANQIIADKTINPEIPKREEVDNNCKDTTDIHKNIKENHPKNDPQFDIPIPLAKKKTKKENKDKSKNTSCINDINKTDGEECIMEFFDGEDHMPLREGEAVIMSFSL